MERLLPLRRKGGMTAYMSVFSTLNAIDVSSKIEEKNGLSFLPWAYAWAELKKLYPDSYYTIYERPDGVNYFTDGKTCWVKTGVTVVDGDWSLEHIESLPVMNVQNRSIPAANVTSFDVNKAIQRSLTKAIARHGLGLYVYAGEDLPEALSAELDGLRTAIRDAMRRAWSSAPALSALARMIAAPSQMSTRCATCWSMRYPSCPPHKM